LLDRPYRELGADDGEVEIETVALCRQVDSVQVAEALRLNQRRDRTRSPDL
jgi:hypothetical protein